MPVNDYGTVTNITQKPIFTEAFAGGVDGNEVDGEGEFRYDLPVGQAVAIMTRLDQGWFLNFPERYEVTVKNKVISKPTPETKRASAEAKGEEVIKQAKAKA